MIAWAPAWSSLGPSVEAAARAVAHPAPQLHGDGHRRPRSARRWRRRGEVVLLEQRMPPAPVFVTLLTGQPKLMSMMSAPAASDMRAASATVAGADPKTCTASGCSSRAIRR